MSEIDLDALKALEKAATPGPWIRSGVRAKLGEESCVTVGPDGPPGAIAFFPIGSLRGDKFAGEAFRDAGFVAALRNVAPALFAAARERDVLKAWSENLRFELLHNYQHTHASHSIRPKPGGDIIEWAAQELEALRSQIDQIRNAKASSP